MKKAKGRGSNETNIRAFAHGPLNTLAEMIEQEREEIIAYWRKEIRRIPHAEKLDTPALEEHLAELLADLAKALRESRMDADVEPEFRIGPQIHGLQRFHAGFDIDEVVAEYHALRYVIQVFAERNHISLEGNVGRIINKVFEKAIGIAVKTYSTQQNREILRRRQERLSFVTHDLKTPLSAIATSAAILDKLLPAAETPTMLMRILRRNVERMEAMLARVIEEESNIKPPTELERRQVELWPLVQKLIEDLHPLADVARTDVGNKIDPDLVVFADAALLTNVFQNLLANALRFTRGGEIEVGARKIESGGSVQCWVKDTGAGMASELAETIFEKTEGHTHRTGSSGLGLAIVKSVVEAHGGKVSVTSQPGVGSVFRFVLPGQAGLPRS
jgi:two-component system, OmpR family, phosphate regulon sensor histidine kinase PhoR